MNSEALALITAAAAGLTNGVISGITLFFPQRKSWLAFLLALLFGILFAYLAAAAYLPPGAAFDRQVLAQLVITGLGAGLASAGLSVTSASATAKREQATGATAEPDPVTPIPNTITGASADVAAQIAAELEKQNKLSRSR
jgi:hypothetical protein